MVRLSRHYKEVKNGKGTNLTISEEKYLSVGKNGEDVTIRGNGKVIAFNNWFDFVEAIDVGKASYFRRDTMKTIGKCKVDEDGNVVELYREYFRQGYVFKDFDAYHNRPTEPCYVPELDDTVYTAEDFLEECGGQKEIADELFESVDWQSPCTLLNEWEQTGEVDTCTKCGKMFMCYGKTECPHCGEEYKNEQMG